MFPNGYFDGVSVEGFTKSITNEKLKIILNLLNLIWYIVTILKTKQIQMKNMMNSLIDLIIL